MDLKTFLLLFLHCFLCRHFSRAFTIGCDHIDKCPDMDCPHGVQNDKQNCPMCQCSPPCPPPHECPIVCESGFKSDPAGCRLCECQTPKCPTFNCSKICIDGYVKQSGCPQCECQVFPCPQLTCKPCTTGYQLSLRGCQSCECVQICSSFRCRILCASPKKHEGVISACGCKCRDSEILQVSGSNPNSF